MPRGIGELIRPGTTLAADASTAVTGSVPRAGVAGASSTAPAAASLLPVRGRPLGAALRPRTG
ncbi:hypothetical protein DEJ30_09715 [Curtobacterium sp. MCPF17_003]|nr:hypothetical protein DEJ30_09715 [Curtobacterium sp. MCPF17_003]PZE67278.1 hypothetical protein DEJ27_11625 [Curtobacterium sp. MCPF17_018]